MTVSLQSQAGRVGQLGACKSVRWCSISRKAVRGVWAHQAFAATESRKHLGQVSPMVTELFEKALAPTQGPGLLGKSLAIHRAAAEE